MTGNQYQSLAMKTNNKNADIKLINNGKGDIINACLGLSGEVGEFNDMIKKWIFHDSKLDMEHLKKECGDIMWYIALMCHSFGWSLDEIMEININKLKARYPEGFNIERSNNREINDV